MRFLTVALLAGCCLGQPLIETPVAVVGMSPEPAVIRIDAPGIKLNLPQYPAVPTSVVVAAVAPVAVVKSAAPVSAVVAPVVSPAAVPVPVVKAAPSPVVVAVAPEPLQAPEPPMPSVGVPFVGGQFHAQDEAGQYTFGHWGGPNTRVETRDSLGRTTGSFAYVDPIGDVQVRKYAADSLNGFKVAASDLPVDNNVVVQDTPEVAEAKEAHARAFNTAKSIIKHSKASA